MNEQDLKILNELDIFIEGLKRGNIEYDKIDDLQDGVRDLITKAEEVLLRKNEEGKWY